VGLGIIAGCGSRSADQQSEEREPSADQQKEERDAKNFAKTQIGLFKGPLNRYRLHTKDFPSTEQGLQALITPPGDADESTVTGWKGPYLDTDALPPDPWGNDYQYEFEGGEFPKVWSWGPDKEDGTEDDISNRGSESSGEGEFGDMEEDLDIEVDTFDMDSGGGFPEPEF